MPIDFYIASPDALQAFARKFGEETVALQELVNHLAELRLAIQVEGERLVALRQEREGIAADYTKMKGAIEAVRRLQENPLFQNWKSSGVGS